MKDKEICLMIPFKQKMLNTISDLGMKNRTRIFNYKF